MYQIPVAPDELLPVGARVRHASLPLHPSPPRRQTPRPLKILQRVPSARKQRFGVFTF